MSFVSSLGRETDSAIDFALLYEIVTTAEQNSNVASHPFRVLFAAYDQVLSEHGLDPNHDQVYLRFLFRLGQSRQEGQTLKGAFESVLLELGFAIEVSGDDFGRNEGARNYEHDPETEIEVEGDTRIQGARKKRSRRASFSSFHDAEDESTRAIRERANSRASLSRLQDNSQGFGSGKVPRTNNTSGQEEKVEAIRQQNKDQKKAGKVNKKQRRHNSVNDQNPTSKIPGSRKTSQQPSGNSQGKAQSNRSQRPLQEVYQYDDSNERDAASSRGRSAHDLGLRSTHAPVELQFYPPFSQLLRDAETFQHFSARRRAKVLLQQWRDLASEARTRTTILHQHAINSDKMALLRQAFDQWFNKHRVIKHAKDTERFFNSLERRAMKSRNLFLLQKAFTHWAECAAERIEENVVARRHIIRFRYFNAWKEITAVNELKVRRQRTKKFFTLWKQKQIAILANEGKALVLYQADLVRTIYWRWFWIFCGTRAPILRMTHLKSKAFYHWVIQTREMKKQALYSSARRDNDLRQKCMVLWLERTRNILAQKKQATDFHRRQIVTNALPIWQRQLRHAPLARHITDMVNWRVASHAFYTLVNQYNLELYAEEVNRKRVVRNAWTTWNDKLRCQTLQNQVADRMVVEALYKWVVAERLVLLARLNEERLKQRTLKKLLNNRRAQVSRNEENITILAKSRDRRVLALAIVKWHNSFRRHEDQKCMAIEFHHSRVIQETMQIWHANYNHQLEMEKWYKEAVFYFRAQRSLKRWCVAVVENQKQKRKDAYSKIRREYKMKLVRSLLQRWHNKTIHIQSLNEAAQDVVEQRTLAFIPDLLVHWQNLRIQNQTRAAMATEHLEATLLTMTFRSWSTRHQSVRTDALTAYTFNRSHLEKIAYDCLRKLKLKVLERHSLTSRAVSVRSWNERRHVRGLLSTWYEKSARRRNSSSEVSKERFQSSLQRNVQTPRTTRRNLFSTMENPEGARPTSRVLTPPDPPAVPPAAFSPEAAEWIPPPLLLEQHAFVTPLPAYLSTPSKRAARARALVMGNASADGGNSASVSIPEGRPESTTPATAPRVTEGLFGERRPFTESRVMTATETEGREFGTSVAGVRRSLFERR